MATSLWRRFGLVWIVCGVIAGAATSAGADEIWVAPTSQADIGGLGVASNLVWPVTPIGVVRLAWGVPNDLQTFQSAKLVLIPHTPAGAGTLNLFVCRAQNSDLVGAACTGPTPHAFTGVTNRLLEVDVSAAIGAQVGAAGLNYLAVLAYTTPTTVTDHIVGMRFAYAPVTPAGVATLGANTFSGTQTAPAFAGNGSGLTNVNATLLDGLDSTAFAATVHGHDVSQVTNAAGLGTNTFTGTQTINTGNLDLDDSTATTGTMTKNGTRFLHNFGSHNTFLGLSAGNLTITGVANTGTGVEALFSNSSGGTNTATGYFALHNNTTGHNNVAVGFAAGNQATTGSNNIYLGSSINGVAGESDTIYLGSGQTKTFIAGIRSTTTGVNNAVPVVIDSNGQLGTISSSRRFKEDIHDMADASRGLFQLRPVTFRYTKPYANGSKPIQFGLVAEEVAEVFPELAVRGADGNVETVHYETLNVLLLNEVQKQQRELTAERTSRQEEQRLQQLRIEALEQKLSERLRESESERAQH